jgi:serine protease Do
MFESQENQHEENLQEQEGKAKQEVEDFSFLQEKIKSESLLGRCMRNRYLRMAVYGLIFGVFASVSFVLVLKLGFHSYLNVQQPETVTIPEDTDEVQEVVAQTPEEEESVSVQPVFDIESYQTMMRSVRSVAQEAKKSLVTIHTMSAGEEEDSAIQVISTSTGVLIADNSQELLILADNVAREGGTQWSVTFEDGSEHEITLKKYDAMSGLVVFAMRRSKVEASTWNHIQVATLGNSNLVRQGDMVIALGDTFGQVDGMSFGMIRLNSYTSTRTDYSYRMLETDLTRSKSGSGVLFNLSGEMIGMIGPYTTGDGQVVQAMAISDMKAVLEQLLNGESVPYVGIVGMTIDEETASEQGIPAGVYVSQVELDSPAMVAGIQNGDILQTINGEQLASCYLYGKQLLQVKAQDSITLAGKRRGANGYVDISFTVVVGSTDTIS